MNTVVDKVINVDTKQDIVASKLPNAIGKPFVLIKNQITRQIKLRSWLGVEQIAEQI